MTALYDHVLTFSGLIAVIGFVVAIVKGGAWLDARTGRATSPLATSITALHMEHDMLARALSDFKVEASRIFVTNEAVARMEARIDDGFRGLRADMSETRQIVLRAIAGGKDS